jgi:hypothetical protein
MELSLCEKCRHYLGGTQCMAFIDGIPQEILNGDNDHSEPLKKQDNELVYENDNNSKLTPNFA